MKKILIPVDYSEYSKRAVETGVKIAKAFGSQVFLLHVNNTRVNYSRYEINLPLESVEASIEQEILRAEDMLAAFKKSFGTSIMDYLTEVRLEHAKKMLENDALTIKHISSCCGFSDQNYFTKVFEKHTGLTPTKYRLSSM